MDDKITGLLEELNGVYYKTLDSENWIAYIITWLLQELYDVQGCYKYWMGYNITGLL